MHCHVEVMSSNPGGVELGVAVISQLYLTSYEILPKCQLTKNHIVFGKTKASSRSKLGVRGTSVLSHT